MALTIKDFDDARKAIERQSDAFWHTTSWAEDKSAIAQGARGNGHQKALNPRLTAMELELKQLRDQVDAMKNDLAIALQEMKDMLIFLELESVERRMP